MLIVLKKLIADDAGQDLAEYGIAFDRDSASAIVNAVIKSGMEHGAAECYDRLAELAR